MIVGDMTTEMVRVLNTHNGETGVLPRRFFENARYNKYLVEVDPNQKAYVAELFKPQTPKKFLENQETKAALKAEKASTNQENDEE